MAGIAVEQRQLVFAFQQRVMFVLAVDVDQQRAECAQRGQRRRAAVDEGLGAAIGADHPAQDGAVPVVERLLGQPAPGRLQTGGGPFGTGY